MFENDDQFADAHYLNLETYRRSGEVRRTPIRFIRDDGQFYIYPVPSAAQVRRISRYPHVRIMPCTPRGKPRGPWVQAEAHVAKPGSDTYLRAQFLRKSASHSAWWNRLPWRRNAKRLVVVLRVVS